MRGILQTAVFEAKKAVHYFDYAAGYILPNTDVLQVKFVLTNLEAFHAYQTPLRITARSDFRLDPKTAMPLAAIDIRLRPVKVFYLSTSTSFDESEFKKSHRKAETVHICTNALRLFLTVPATKALDGLYHVTVGIDRVGLSEASLEERSSLLECRFHKE